MKLFVRLPVILFLLIISVSAFSEEKAETSSIAPLDSLIEWVVLTDEDSINQNVPDYLSEIIGHFSADTIVSDSIPMDVLSYLTGIYSDHGYHDTGNWAVRPDFVKYVPYSGELPKYDFSDFRMPVMGRLTSGFGYRPKFQRQHHGIDIDLNVGDTVRCALPGVVVKTGYEHKGYGSYVIVAHSGNMETVYAHLQSPIVIAGQNLKSGDPVGIGGNTGRSTGPHLHFETRYLGVAIDPVTWFNLGSYF